MGDHSTVDPDVCSLPYCKPATAFEKKLVDSHLPTHARYHPHELSLVPEWDWK